MSGWYEIERRAFGSRDWQPWPYRPGGKAPRYADGESAISRVDAIDPRSGDSFRLVLCGDGGTRRVLFESGPSMHDAPAKETAT